MLCRKGWCCSPGAYVIVPLGNREIPGIVWEGAPDPVPAKKLKSVLTTYDLAPLSAVNRRFIDWVAHYNMAPLGFVLKMMMSVPGAAGAAEAGNRLYAGC